MDDLTIYKDVKIGFSGGESIHVELDRRTFESFADVMLFKEFGKNDLLVLRNSLGEIVFICRASVIDYMYITEN